LESCRVTQKTLIVTVSHRARLIQHWIDESLAKLGRFSPAVQPMLERGWWQQEQFAENEILTRGYTQDYLAAMKAFLPNEIAAILGRAGMNVLRCGGLGTLAGLCKQATVDAVLGNAGLFQEFVGLCDDFDRRILPRGPGTLQRAGLIAVAQRPDA
jgi:hypothetical protein